MSESLSTTQVEFIGGPLDGERWGDPGGQAIRIPLRRGEACFVPPGEGLPRSPICAAVYRRSLDQPHEMHFEGESDQP